MSEVLVSDLTQAKIDGTGVYDVLMRATKAHLETEFSKNRIKGSEYATVYLGSMESVLKISLDFLLQKQKIALEALLLEQQIILAGVAVQKAELERQTLAANLPKITAEIAVLVAQECKLRAEYDNLILQKARTTAETALLAQKLATEKAQTTALGVDVDSILGRQKALYQAQASGFTRDAEQKAAKLMVDSWNVRRTTDEGTVADNTNKLSDSAVGSTVAKMLNGIGVAV